MENILLGFVLWGTFFQHLQNTLQKVAKYHKMMEKHQNFDIHE